MTTTTGTFHMSEGYKVFSKPLDCWKISSNGWLGEFAICRIDMIIGTCDVFSKHRIST